DGTRFVLLDSFVVSSLPTGFVLNGGSFQPDAGSAAIAFDNFKVNTGTVTCPSAAAERPAPTTPPVSSARPAPTTMDDNFDDNSLEASRWSLETVRPGYSATVRETNS